nr:MAG TPA: hypothetical protein [Crassvirales sp.]
MAFILLTGRTMTPMNEEGNLQLSTALGVPCTSTPARRLHCWATTKVGRISGT